MGYRPGTENPEWFLQYSPRKYHSLTSVFFVFSAYRSSFLLSADFDDENTRIYVTKDSNSDDVIREAQTKWVLELESESESESE